MILPTNLANAPTIPQLARKLGVGRRTMFNRLFALHGQDRIAGRELWLFRVEGGRWRVDTSRLRRSHPELFEAPAIEDVAERVTALEDGVAELQYQHRAMAKRIGEIGAAVAGGGKR